MNNSLLSSYSPQPNDNQKLAYSRRFFQKALRTDPTSEISLFQTQLIKIYTQFQTKRVKSPHGEKKVQSLGINTLKNSQSDQLKAVNFIITLSRVLRIGCEQGISYAMKAQGKLPFMVSLNQTNMSSNKLSPIHRNKTSLIKACLTKAIIKS